jgi:hypothetical protein
MDLMVRTETGPDHEAGCAICFDTLEIPAGSDRVGAQ